MRSFGRTFARVALALLASAAGCELLVDGKLHTIHCADEGAVGPPACPTGEQCVSGVCAAARLGAACVTDADCHGGDLCVAASVFGAEGAPRCTRPCCTSADCDPDPGFVCAVARTGAGSFCRSGVDLGRTAGGSLAGGAPCVADAECRSGRCFAEHCADTCCANAACDAGQGACRFREGPDGEPEGFWCAEPRAEKLPRYATCNDDAQCASGLCIAFDGEQEVRRCSMPCCASAECEALPDKGRPVTCGPVRVGSTWVRACSALSMYSGLGEVGSACEAASECRSGVCEGAVGAAKRCSDTCCTDATCGDPSSFACRPVEIGASWALRCEPK